MGGVFLHHNNQREIAIPASSFGDFKLQKRPGWVCAQDTGASSCPRQCACAYTEPTNLNLLPSALAESTRRGGSVQAHRIDPAQIRRTQRAPPVTARIVRGGGPRTGVGRTRCLAYRTVGREAVERGADVRRRSFTARARPATPFPPRLQIHLARVPLTPVRTSE